MVARLKNGELRERALRCMPGGVNSSMRLHAPPIHFARGEGSWIFDVDGNGYIDYLLGWGPAFLGHAPPTVVGAVEEASRRGQVFGAQHELEVEAAEAFVKTVEWADMVRIANTGTEIVQAAIRLARAYTGRRKIVRFDGHYHGWADNIFFSLTEPEPMPASVGQTPDDLADCITLPWNDTQALEHLLEDRGEDIAAVLMEPVMYNSAGIVPARGYLEAARDACTRYGVVLIFDEVQTGFRISLGGAAERFGVAPDLATYGKALGGGWPVSALAGRGDVMDFFANPKVVHQGTFNANMMASAALIATLGELRKPGVYDRLEKVGSKLIDGLRRTASTLGIQMSIRGFPGIFHVAFGNPTGVQDHASGRQLDTDSYKKLHPYLIDEGIWVPIRGTWYVSMAHSVDDVDDTLERFGRALERFVSATQRDGTTAGGTA